MAVWRGAVAGIVGTAVLHLLGSKTDRDTVYAPKRLALRLASRYAKQRLSSRQARRAGTALRWLYGPSWGVALGQTQDRLGEPYVVAGVQLALAIWAFELIALPLTGATPSLRDWGPRQILGDAVQALLFGVATASAYALLDSGI